MLMREDTDMSKLSNNKNNKGQKMWGGRFSASPSEIMQEINVSIDFDKRLALQDIRGSLAHSSMLEAQGIITKEDMLQIHRGLKQIEKEILNLTFPFSPEFEDIHLNIENRLKEIIGEAAGRLHTARSRNDQVATDFRLWVRDSLDGFEIQLLDLMKALLQKASENTDTIMPGFTHLQSAQPVTFGHHMLAYLEMFNRDKSRFNDCRKRLNECPLGAAALAGTPFPIDRDFTSNALGFSKPMANSLDAVSARDFALEALSAATICATHLSRLSEELVIWMSAQFQFITLTDSYTTGSSIMPQKRNPDAAELIRAKVGRISGSLVALTMVMKGLPLAYSKDMQEDKEPVFDAFDSLDLGLKAMTGMIKDMQPNKEILQTAAGNAFSTATDLADWLVRKLNMPFRNAHHVTGKIVALAEQKGMTLSELTLDEYIKIEPKITKDIYSILSPLSSAESRVSYGGTAPSEVEKQVAIWSKILS
jgi:argininosuccinate lyase